MVKLRAEMDQKMEETREMAICVFESLALVRELEKSGVDPAVVKDCMQSNSNSKDSELEQRARLHALIVAEAQRRAAKASERQIEAKPMSFSSDPELRSLLVCTGPRFPIMQLTSIVQIRVGRRRSRHTR